eukprot:TRINITY_DN1450_c0_g2_i1.p1 TRINITY_DN1450_c0_g2~~TRINITY_DN1450_c0_g2_i1.p1  ORF type:complete len:683 (+),score=134.54 TRINITY_DN1450_c0_g2_i1:246-2294(+)
MLALRQGSLHSEHTVAHSKLHLPPGREKNRVFPCGRTRLPSSGVLLKSVTKPGACRNPRLISANFSTNEEKDRSVVEHSETYQDSETSNEEPEESPANLPLRRRLETNIEHDTEDVITKIEVLSAAVDTALSEKRVQKRDVPVAFLIPVLRSIIRVLNGSTLREWAAQAPAEQQGLVEGDSAVDDNMEQRAGGLLKAKTLQWLSDDDEEEGGGEMAIMEGREQKGLPVKMESEFFKLSRQIWKFSLTFPAIFAVVLFQLADRDPQDQSAFFASCVAGIVLGAMLGVRRALESLPLRRPRNVLITGSTRGLGKALAREFLRMGDNVIVTSRSENAVQETVMELQMERSAQLLQQQQRDEQQTGRASAIKHEVVGVMRRKMEGSVDELLHDSGNMRSPKAGKMTFPRQGRVQKLLGMACDVSSSADVKALAAAAVDELGTLDIWVNNAGSNAGAKLFVECSDEEIERVVSTNLLGSCYCSREAIRIMKKQARGGHVFNMDGAGTSGAATPNYAAYGASKAGLRQLHQSLLKECRFGRVGVHTASPGMVLTDLLLSGATLQNKQAFNIVCEQPETVARALVPQIRAVRGTGKAVSFLTPPRIILALLSAWVRRGRWFDKEGRAVYLAEAERLRIWAEGEERSPMNAAMAMVPDGALLSLAVSCSFICMSFLWITTGAGPPGGGGT